MYWNPEHYPDPTDGAALRQLYRKEKDLNTGKQFEADWKKSMPPDAWCYRLKDSAASYYGGNENLSFSIDNICDFDVYRYPMHHYFELKTIETPSIQLTKIFGSYDPRKAAVSQAEAHHRHGHGGVLQGPDGPCSHQLPWQGEPHLCGARKRRAGLSADPDPQKYSVAVGRPARHRGGAAPTAGALAV